MKWKFVKGQNVFQAHSQQWDALNASLDNHILLDSNFWIPLVNVFGHDELYLGFSENHDHPGMILVEQVGPGQWRTFQPPQAPLGPILLANPLDIDQQLSGLLDSLPGMAITVGITQQDPDHTVIRPENGQSRLEFLDYIITPRIALVGTFEAYWNTRGKDLVGNLARRKKRLDEQGVKMSLAEHRAAQCVDDAVKTYGQFEASGWKGEQGTAVRADNAQGAFYREMLARFCHRGEGIIYQLLMDEKPIASNLCVERNGMMILLKTAYDEDYKKFSPSYFMLEEILKRLFVEKNIHVLEFYGRTREWHKKWGGEERTMYHVNFYRSAMVFQARQFLKTKGLWSHVKG